MSRKYNIIGASLTGLIAGFMNPGSTIYTAGKKLNNNAIIRCKSDALSKLTGIPFKRVEVKKEINLHGEKVCPTIKACNLYSKKVTGRIQPSRSISTVTDKPVIRYIPPEDFYERLLKMVSEKCDISSGNDWKDFLYTLDYKDKTPIISTLPLYEHYPDPVVRAEFNFIPIAIKKIKIKNCEDYSTIYFPGNMIADVYRISLNKDIVIMEAINSGGWDEEEILSDMSEGLIEYFGIDQDDIISITEKIQEHGKMIDLEDNRWRRNLIGGLTKHFKIFSLGRLATWRSKVMLDDLIDDIEQIWGLTANMENNYKE